MRVLLISTPYPLEENPIPPLSLSYLAAVLLREGFEVEILDLLVAKYSAAKIRRKLEEYGPQVVGTTCVTMTFPTAAKILRVCKDFDPGIFTVIGGPHVSFAIDDTLRRAPWIDIVVSGEGERTMIELTRALEEDADLSQVAGIAFRKNQMVVKTAPRAAIEDLDELPFPARYLLPLSKYRALGAPCTVISTRGCPYSCIFCTAHRMFGRRVRFRNPKLVVDEIESLHRGFGFPQINIVDDTFTLNHKHVTAICQEMIRRNLNIQWNVFSRVDTLSRPLLELMKEAGCAWALFGVESGSQQILDTVKKGITLDGVRKGAKLAAEVGINTFASFILGLPGETPESARKTVAFARELNQDYGAKYGFHLLSPFPGTEVYEEAERYGLRILTTDWARYNANEPVTEASPGSVPTIREIDAEYNRAIEYAWEEMRRKAAAGNQLSAEALQQRQTGEFVWRLLKEDFIERLGRVKPLDAMNPAAPEEDLAQVASRKLDLPLDMTRREVGRLVRQGLLKADLGDKGVRWQWA